MRISTVCKIGEQRDGCTGRKGHQPFEATDDLMDALGIPMAHVQLEIVAGIPCDAGIIEKARLRPARAIVVITVIARFSTGNGFDADVVEIQLAFDGRFTVLHPDARCAHGRTGDRPGCVSIACIKADRALFRIARKGMDRRCRNARPLRYATKSIGLNRIFVAKRHRDRSAGITECRTPLAPAKFDAKIRGSNSLRAGQSDRIGLDGGVFNNWSRGRRDDLDTRLQRLDFAFVSCCCCVGSCKPGLERNLTGAQFLHQLIELLVRDGFGKGR